MLRVWPRPLAIDPLHDLVIAHARVTSVASNQAPMVAVVCRTVHPLLIMFLTEISHLGSCPRPAWAFFVIFFLLHRFASHFCSPFSAFLWQRGYFDAFLSAQALFLPDEKTPPPYFPVF